MSRKKKGKHSPPPPAATPPPPPPPSTPSPVSTTPSTPTPPTPTPTVASSSRSSTPTRSRLRSRFSRGLVRATTLAGAGVATVASPTSSPLNTYRSVVDGQNPLSVGEYCTLTRAKELGIFNETMYTGSSTQAPFGADYTDLKTYNESIDSKDSRLKTLCKTVIQGSDPETAKAEAYPHCIDVKGPGFVKRASNTPESPYQCQVYACPPGFGQTGEFCSKEPMYKDALIDKRSRCDERWYDWFLLPNYHLGNKYYEESVGKCYVPCPDKYVPYFSIDPVDGSKMGIFAENKLTQCVPKAEYFGGKYALNSDYCPLAWIFRLYACNKDNVKQLIQQKREMLKTAYPNQTTTIFANASADDSVNKEALYISGLSQKFIENVPFPKDAMLQACNTLNTKERLDTAYTICDRLNREGALNLTGGEDANSSVNTSRNEVLKQACNAVFCNEQVGSLDIIAKDPVCFESLKKIDPASVVTMSEEQPSRPDYSENENFFYKSFIVTLFIVMFMVGGMVCWLVFTRIIWPSTRWFWYKLLGMFTGRKYAYVKYRVQAMEEIARARSRAAAAMSQ